MGLREIIFGAVASSVIFSGCASPTIEDKVAPFQSSQTVLPTPAPDGYLYVKPVPTTLRSLDTHCGRYDFTLEYVKHFGWSHWPCLEEVEDIEKRIIDRAYSEFKVTYLKQPKLERPADGNIIADFYPLFHPAFDISSPYGAPINAAGDGIVVLKKLLTRSYGYHVIIEHDDNLFTLYAHI